MLVKLKDVCKIKPGYAFNSNDFGHGAAKCIKITNISFSIQETELINVEENDKLKDFIVNDGDIIMSMTSATQIGKIGRLRKHTHTIYLNQRLCKFEADETKINKDYLFFVLSQNNFNKFIRSSADSKSLQQNISHYTIGEFTFELPNLKIQNKIAEILSNIDNQIERNNTMVKRLQDLGNTIFSAYFKDCKNVISFTEFPYCEILKPFIDKFDNTKHYIATAEVNGINLNFDAPLITYENRESRANMQPIKNSIWFAKLKNSIKHIYVPNNDMILTNDYIFSTGFCGIKCDKIAYEFLIGFIESPYFEIMKDKLAHGATMESINNDDLSSINIPLPTKDILEKYHSKTKNIYEQISMLQIENHKLIQLKQQLLPLLINGQIEI